MDGLKSVFFVFVLQEIPSSRREIFLVRLCHAHSQCRLSALSPVVNVKCRRPHECCSQTLGGQSTQLLQNVALHVLSGLCVCGSASSAVTVIAVCDSTVICAVTESY